MKHLLLTTIAAVLLVGCGPSVDFRQAAIDGDIEAVKQAIADGADVNAKTNAGMTPLSLANVFDRTEIADLLRKHGGKTKSELKAEGK